MTKRVLYFCIILAFFLLIGCGSGSNDGSLGESDFTQRPPVTTAATTAPTTIRERPETTRTTPSTQPQTEAHTTPLPNNSRMGTWSEVEIIGDGWFTERSTLALDQIRNGSPYHWDMVLRYMGILRQYVSSGMWYWLDPPEFRVGTGTYSASAIWYASSIVHDAWHSWQAYHYDQNPFIDPHSDEWFYAEMDAIRVQIEFLEAINAPRHYITHLEGMIGQRWWLGPITW